MGDKEPLRSIHPLWILYEKGILILEKVRGVEALLMIYIVHVHVCIYAFTCKRFPFKKSKLEIVLRGSKGRLIKYPGAYTCM